MNFIRKAILRLSDWALKGGEQKVTDRAYLEKEIAKWKNSPKRILQIKGHLYYEGEQDILTRKRTVIGESGSLEAVENLPNNRIIDNQYAKLVNQKANYLFGQPMTIEDDNDEYVQLLRSIFDKRFMRILKNTGKAALNSGIAWLFPYYNDDGKLSFRLFPGYEILPFWKDSEHTKLDFAVRLYLVEQYRGHVLVEVEKVEVFTNNGIERYTLDAGILIPENSTKSGRTPMPYVAGMDTEGVVQGLNWDRIPLIPFKYNEQELPLLKKVKSLQDGINVMLSDFENNMQEDARNTILVIKNYDGQNLGEFRKNLATYGAVKVRYDEETKGGVDTLEVNVNADNYKMIVEIFKKALIENGMGYDAKDDRMGGTPNQMNIQSMYSDIDLDANDMETEFQSAFEELLWFVNVHLSNMGKGDFFDETITVIFNRDMMMNEGEIIDNCSKSIGILSDETIIGQHPWIDDPQLELDRLKKQKEKERREFEEQQGYNPFAKNPSPNKGGEEE